MRNVSLTERAERVLELARSEAARRQHESITPEHIILGLILEGEGVAIAVLRNLDASPSALWRDLEAELPAGVTRWSDHAVPAMGDRANHALRRAFAYAQAQEHYYVGTEHLLVGILQEAAGAASRVLGRHGVAPQNATLETARLLAM
jgi:ATP-dependent Clp protease ATP-binding subunit ClpC